MRATPALAAGGRTVANLLSATEWMLPSPASQVHTISVFPSQSPNPRHEFAFSNLTTWLGNGGRKGVEAESPKFHVVRDDLLHPLANGNKARKLDALLPLLRRRGATDIVRSFTSAVPAFGISFSAMLVMLTVPVAGYMRRLPERPCRSRRPHILLRGEQLDVPTGYNLISLMFGNVTYASRSVYAQRDEMLYEHATKVAGSNGTVMWADDIVGEDLVADEDITYGNCSRRVMIVKEGAGTVQALLGAMRLVDYLSGTTLFGQDEKVHIVVDSGTGTTAVGLALGARSFSNIQSTKRKMRGALKFFTAIKMGKEKKLRQLLAFTFFFPEDFSLRLQWRVTAVMLADTLESLVQWVERSSPRRFGKVLDGEIAMCRQVAQQTGVLLDPMYTLAAWEQAVDLCRRDSEAKVVMVHTGGTLGLFGLAQRYPPQFTADEQP
ncbi:putative D-cysteine desulfhydrase 2, mitochondrial [Panicum miliaceum]|uniref:D-cysteine desulfhydrase 2, mitochondrial n=1 Tax=Panicum miliaceum TaxID=4540 RepID=A0A3L6SQ46_PANMI|nr:putative D-cysteine desulfhydrase 2, mitochondrial [Panicum miliaceum]